MVNQDQVKDSLMKLYDCKEDFKVLFSGKKSKKVNGLYKRDSREIVIHNLNFQDGDGNQNDMSLMFTAIHELAHHVRIVEMGDKKSNAHNQEFWATFHNLLDVAEKKGIYKAKIDSDVKSLIEEAQEISRQIAALQRELGRVMLAINDACQKKGLRYDDVVERKIQIEKKSVDVAITSYQMGDHGVGADIQAAAAKERDEDKRAEIIKAGQDGKSVIQAKTFNGTAKPVDQEDTTTSLLKEEKRLKRTIELLTRRLKEVEQQLADLGELLNIEHGADAA
jgi:prefoldin subunit 5